MCYSSFETKVMPQQKLFNWNKVYKGSQLDYLIYCLVKSGYLEKPYNPKPYAAMQQYFVKNKNGA